MTGLRHYARLFISLAASNLTEDSLRTSGLTALHIGRVFNWMKSPFQFSWPGISGRKMRLKISILTTWSVRRQPISSDTGQSRSKRDGKKTADIHHLL